MLQHYHSGYFVVTNQGLWGRSLNLGEALKSAKVKNPATNLIEYNVTTLLFKQHTPEEKREKILTFYCVDDLGQVCTCSDLTKEDKELIITYLHGFTVSMHRKK